MRIDEAIKSIHTTLAPEVGEIFERRVESFLDDAERFVAQKKLLDGSRRRVLMRFYRNREVALELDESRLRDVYKGAFEEEFDAWLKHPDRESGAV